MIQSAAAENLWPKYVDEVFGDHSLNIFVEFSVESACLTRWDER